jgi:PAS domain S-box-containing protein
MISNYLKRKQAEEALRIKDNAIESSINGIGIADLKGYLTYANNSYLKMWGYDEKEALGTHVNVFWLKEEDVTEVIEALHGMGGWIGELKAKRKGGSLFDVELSASLVKDEAGNPICMMASFIDITKRKLAEEALRMYSRELEESNSALKILLRQRENDRREIEEKIMDNVKQIVLPYIEMLKKKKREIPEDKTYLNIIESNLKEIVSSFTTSLSHRLANLTPKEMLIANLVKEGKQDKDIAEVFYLSIDTIKAHRRNIRKKLNLIGKKTNLRTFLSDLK